MGGGGRQARQGIGDKPGGLCPEKTLRQGLRLAGKGRKTHRRAQPGKTGVALNKILQRYPQTAQRHGKPGHAARHLGTRPRPAKRGQKVRRTQRLGQADDGNVQRLDQRLAHRKGAAEVPVEILRFIAAERHGAVVDQRFGMCQSLIEGQRVDEGLQRRTGRPQRLRHVDKAVARLIAPVGRPDRGEDFAGPVIRNHDGHRQTIARPVGRILSQLFQGRLQRPIQRRVVNAGRRVCPPQRL